MSNLLVRLSVALVAALALSSAASAKQKISWNGAEPAPGVYFYWYEPSFYTGFAPRTQSRERVHMELGRGNQQRMTLVPGPEEQDAYLDNLLARRNVVREMVEKDVIKLTTNLEFDRYEQALQEAGVEDTASQRATLGEAGYREQSVAIMEKLNPQRVFRIAIPVTRAAAAWHPLLTALGKDGNRLDAANAALPGRLNLLALEGKTKAALDEAIALAGSGAGPEDPGFVNYTAAFIELASGGRYAAVDGEVRAIEFTAIYPAGTAKAWSNYKGEKLPEFGVTGVWPLVERDHGKGIMGMVDYLSTNPGYGFIPLLGYQYAGGIAYNAIHNAGVRSPLDSTKYLPPEWRKVAGERNPKKNYQNLWVGSRGPASHGCTRLPSGHMSEMRDALPSTSEDMVGVSNFRNKPQCFDLFDIDGDGQVEVMGVQYYIAYWGKKHLPKAPYAPNDRKGFYTWLYKDNVSYNADDSAVMKDVPVCRFVGLKKAQEAQVLHDVPLYEAPYARESIQFYQVKPVNFQTRKGFELNRELRRIGTGHESDRAKLLLK